jgi:NAD(P)-dependent dehydrogenase (short-subunit alcohol dehydrogenase family)
LFPETAIVTGGRSGIGAAIVAALESDGTDVEVLDLADGFDVSTARDWEGVLPADLVCLNAGVLTGRATSACSATRSTAARSASTSTGSSSASASSRR